MSVAPESGPGPASPGRQGWETAGLLLATILVLATALTVGLWAGPPGLEVDRLAEGHPHAGVFEVSDPDPTSVAAAVALLEQFPELGAPQISTDPASPGWVGPAGEARILVHPDGPVAQETLEAVARAVDSRPEVRWTLAPGERTWEVSRALRPFVAVALLALAFLGVRLRQPLRAAAPLIATSGVLWLWGPVAPVVLAFVPLAAIAGWVAARSRFPWLVLAAGPLWTTGHPHLQSIAVLLAIPACVGTVLAWVRAPHPAEDSAGDPENGSAWSGRAAGVLAGCILLGAVATAPAPPATLLERVPRTATVLQSSLTPAALDALQDHGLGTIEGAAPTGGDAVLQAHHERLDGRFAVPLVGHWVEEAFADTLAAEAPEATLSLPRRAPAAVPWLGVGAFGVLFVASGLLVVADPRLAVARLLPALGAIPALLWVSSGVGPETAALAIGLAPILATMLATMLESRESIVEAVVLGVLPVVPFAGVGQLDLALGWSMGVGLGVLLRHAAPAVSAGLWPAPRVRRWGARLAWLTLVLVHVDVLVLLLVSFSPPPPGEPLDASIEQVGRTLHLGPHQLHREHGVFVLATRGEPYETGLAAATLANPLRRRLEVELFDAYVANVPYGAARWLISRGSAVAGAGLEAELRPEHRVELRGDIDAAPEHYAFAGPSYTRKVYYHAIHDIGQALVDTPLLGCTGFVAGPGITSDQHWRVGRAFDFDGGVAFDRDKVIRLHEPTDGHAFLSVAFAGIVGAVSGVNEAGIAVVINASGSEDPPRPGTPMTLIVREILQHAATMEEAAAILEARTGFVSENVLVVDADASDGAGKATLFEVSPARVARLEVDDWLAFSNHFRTETFADDPVNQDRIRELTTVPRLLRAQELVTEHAGRLDQRAGAAILSDRRGSGGAALPRGHRHALNADIATHGVVIDATDRSLWVSVYPNLSGGWVSLSLDDAKAGRLAPVRQVDADPDAWRAVEIRTARELLRASRRSRPDRAALLAERALQIWPDHPESLLEAGVHRLEAGDPTGDALLDRAEAAPLEYLHQARSIDAVRAHSGEER